MRTGRNVDKFLPVILRTGTKNDYLFHFLVPSGIREHFEIILLWKKSGIMIDNWILERKPKGEH